MTGCDLDRHGTLSNLYNKAYCKGARRDTGVRRERPVVDLENNMCATAVPKASQLQQKEKPYKVLGLSYIRHNVLAIDTKPRLSPVFLLGYGCNAVCSINYLLLCFRIIEKNQKNKSKIHDDDLSAAYKYEI